MPHRVVDLVNVAQMKALQSQTTSWVREAWFSLISGLVLKIHAMISNVIFLFPVCLPIPPHSALRDLPVHPTSSQASHAPLLNLQVVLRGCPFFVHCVCPPPCSSPVHRLLSVLQCINGFNSSSAALWSPSNSLLFTPVPLLSSRLAVLSQRFTMVREAAELVLECRERTVGWRLALGHWAILETFWASVSASGNKLGCWSAR